MAGRARAEEKEVGWEVGDGWSKKRKRNTYPLKRAGYRRAWNGPLQKERIRKLETAKGRKERKEGRAEAKSAKGNAVLETENGERRTANGERASARERQMKRKSRRDRETGR